MRPVVKLSLVVMGGWGCAAFGTTPFTVVVMPDPQNYADSQANTNTYFKGQTNWIVSHRTSNNIAFMLGLGDYQNDGNPFFASATDPYSPDPNNKTGYIADDHLYARADSAFDILDAAGVPYALVAGNHDYLHYDIKDQPIYYLKWFGPQRFANKPWVHGASPETPTSLAGMDNFAIFDAGGRKFLNIGLQYEPDKNDLAWAQSIINANPGIPTILTTHAMLDTNGYQAGRQNIWDTFAKNNPQILMTINGHITGEYRQNETNIAGQTVPEMLVDYQATEFDGLFRGGGYMRLMQFDPDNSVVHVKSYSPVANDYLTDKANQFDLPMDINTRFGAAPGTAGHLSTISFKNGVNAYNGTRDTYIDATQTGTDHSAETGVWTDGDADGSTTGKQARHGLVKFTNLFSADRIPAGAVIESATLTLTTDTATDSQTTSSMSLYRMLGSWSNSSTWSSLGGSIAADGTDAILAANGTVTPTAKGATVTFDVTESVYAWLEGADDNGWAILPNGNDGWRFASSEAVDVDMRPELDVTYFVVPEPGGVAAMLVMCAMLKRRRRREARGLRRVW